MALRCEKIVAMPRDAEIRRKNTAIQQSEEILAACTPFATAALGTRVARGNLFR